MKTHHLKTWPEYFKDLVSGIKTFELRYNDRDFKVGDEIIFEEWEPITKSYTGNSISFNINYIMAWIDSPLIAQGLKANYVIMGLTKIENKIADDDKKLSDAMNVLRNELNKDKSEGSYYYSWRANIAMAFKDEFHRYADEKEISATGRNFNIHQIANNAAKNFLDLLCR